MLISLADVLKKFLFNVFILLSSLKNLVILLNTCFYNTKIIPLFRTNSNIRQKSMFYNIFLDLNQK